MIKLDPKKEKRKRREFLKQAAEMLDEKKRGLVRGMRGRDQGDSEGAKDEGRDTGDLASDERNREMNSILNKREREKLVAIDEALLRIKKKTYGICDNCEGEIHLGRLKIMPFTRLCVKCQEENEKESNRQKVLDNERGDRRSALTDVDEEESP